MKQFNQRGNMQSWYKIKAKGKAVELSIFDEIGGFGISAQAFINDLNAVKNASEINLSISSTGGSVQDGVAIFNAIKRHPAHVNVSIVGWALSIASYIAMAGDRVSMAENALMMIHNAWTDYVAGDSRELRRSADVLEKVTESLVDAYAAKTAKSKQEISSMLDAETWMNAEEALAHGFIDEISEPLQMAASLNLKKFNLPEKMKGLIMSQANTDKPTQHQDPQASAILAQENERRMTIRANFSKFSERPGVTELMGRLENDINCSVEVANRQLLDLLGSQATPIAGSYSNEGLHFTDRTREFIAAASDALILRAGIKINDPNPMVKDVQRMDITSMAERILSMRGYSVQGKSRTDIIKAAHTTSDFPLLLADTAGKALRIGYENEVGTHVIWTGEKEVADFKPQSMVALSEAPNLLEVPEAAEYKHGTFGESAEKFEVKTYGRIFAITRQALINDDLQAFTSLPSAFGAAARRLEADLVYGKLLSSGAMSDGKALFHEDHGNLAATGTVLNIASLAVARAAMRRQKGINGLQHIDPVPRFLIVPVALETSAEQLVSSLIDPSKSNDTANIQWVRNLTVVADPRLDENSETAWYLSASPSQIDGIVRAYLAGQDRPYYEVDEEFNRDVTSVKARLDFAVGTIDFRAMYKNPGAAN